MAPKNLRLAKDAGAAAPSPEPRDVGPVEDLFDLAPEAMLVIDPFARIIRVNDELVRWLGYEREALVGARVDVLLRGLPASDGWLPDVLAAQERGEWLTVDAVTSDDRVLPVELHLKRVHLKDATVTCASLRDLTDSRRAQDAFQLAEERFRGAFDQAPIGMALVAMDGRFLKVNRALCELVGFSEQQLLRLGFEDITHPDDLRDDLSYVQKLIAGDIRTFQMEKCYLDSTSESIWVNLSVSLARDVDGRPLHFTAQVQDITERRMLEAQLRHLADHDPLTGVLNRRGLEAELRRHVAAITEDDRPGALIVLDLDHLQSVNDTLGHRAGDELIVAVADRLTERLRPTDTVARIGGDEFAVIVHDVDITGARAAAESIVAAIHDQALPLAGHEHQHVTASVGATMLQAGLAHVEDALVTADLAMYDAKEAGRDRVSVHSGDISDINPARKRFAWIQRIRAAIEEQRFTFVLQPILRLGTGEVRQYELLLRMVDEHGAVIPPGAFLSVAERYGLIGDLDRWVVRQSVRMIAESERSGKPLVLEVNLSGKSLGDPRLLEAIETELSETGVDPGSLIFEVTETAAVANIDVAREFAAKLSALGCRFALDDFGAGFGSFYYLKHLPADYLKIDGEFVTRCTTNRTDQYVIRALVQIARGLHKQTVAECVEDAETLEFLRENGVDFAQGNYVGSPFPADQYGTAHRS